MLALLQQAESVFVNFDPRREGVVLPAHLKRQPRVVLQYGLNMRIPIPDLDVSEDGIGATLSFDRAPTWTFIPWSAVFAIVSQDQQGMLWEADLPREIDAEQRKGPAPEPAKKGAAGGKGSKKSAAKRPALRAVDGGQRAPRAAKEQAQPASEPSPQPPAPVVAEPVEASAPPSVPEPSRPSRESDEIIEPPEREPKKKRELPPYLRVVK